MIEPTPIVYRSKRKWYKHQKIKKFALKLQLKTIQILTNDVQMLILCLSYYFTAVIEGIVVQKSVYTSIYI